MNKKLVGLGAIALAAFAPAHAAVTYNDCTILPGLCLLTELDAGGSIVIDDVVFDNFLLTDVDGVGLPPAEVTGSSTASSVTLSFDFTQNLGLFDVDDFIEYFIDFEAAITSTRTFSGAELELFGAGGDGDAFIEVAALLIDGDADPLLLTASDPFFGDIVSDSGSLASVSMLTILMDIQGEVFEEDAFVEISGFSLTLDLAGDVAPEIPVPGALVLMATGLGIGAWRRKKAVA